MICSSLLIERMEARRIEEMAVGGQGEEQGEQIDDDEDDAYKNVGMMILQDYVLMKRT